MQNPFGHLFNPMPFGGGNLNPLSQLPNSFDKLGEEGIKKVVLVFEAEDKCAKVFVECSMVVFLGFTLDEASKSMMEETAKTLAKRGLKQGSKIVLRGILPFTTIVSGGIVAYQTYECIAEVTKKYNYQ